MAQNGKHMRENTLMENLMVMEFIPIHLVSIMKGNGCMEENGKGNTFGTVDTVMKAILSMD